MSTIPNEVIRRYAFKNELPVAEAVRLFDEVEAFLDASTESAQVPDRRLDSAWHEFILHTKQYQEYCVGRYGRIVHHVPTSPLAGGEDRPRPKPDDCGSGIDDSRLPSCYKCQSDCSADCRRDAVR